MRARENSQQSTKCPNFKSVNSIQRSNLEWSGSNTIGHMWHWSTGIRVSGGICLKKETYKFKGCCFCPIPPFTSSSYSHFLFKVVLSLSTSSHCSRIHFPLASLIVRSCVLYLFGSFLTSRRSVIKLKNLLATVREWSEPVSAPEYFATRVIPVGILLKKIKSIWIRVIFSCLSCGDP